MSASRPRILVGDDAALARIREGLGSRIDVEIVTVASTADAVRLLSSPPAPAATLLPGEGAIDGIAVCKQVGAIVKPDLGIVLVLPADTQKRDAAFIVGADDVIVGPADAGLVLRRVKARTSGQPFQGAPKASVPFQVNLQTVSGQVLHANATTLSREALQVQLPASAPLLGPNALLRATYTLYQGGTFTVWARVSSVEKQGDLPGRATLRLVGLTPNEYAAIDYFVDFYSKTPSTVPAVENTGEIEAAKESAPAAAASTDDVAVSDATLGQVAEADIGALAAFAGKIAGGRREAEPPPGFSGARLRASVPRLSPVETSALRGTTMYNEILGDLRAVSGTKLKLFELAAQIKSGAKLDKKSAETIAMTAIAEAEQIHTRMQEHLQNRLKQGDTRAVRDLNPVTAGLLNACSELKFAVDKHVLGKAGPAPSVVVPSAAAAAGPIRYDKSEKPAAATGAGAAAEKPARASGGGSRRMLRGGTVALLAAGAIWSNRGLFNGAAPQRFIAPDAELEYKVGGLRVWRTFVDGTNYVCVVDDSWRDLDAAARDAALAELAVKAAAQGAQNAKVLDARGSVLAEKRVGG